jgi:hypothetical protein
MKIVRWAAAAVLTLMSLMNLGAGTADDRPPVAVIVFGIVLGLAGLVAAYGLIRRTSWGRPAALAVGAINVVAAVVGLAVGAEGAAIGLVVSALAVALCFFASDRAPVFSRAQATTQ